MRTTCDALKARNWFVWREPVNWAVTIGLFIPIYSITLLVLGGLLAAVICIVAAFCLFFFVLEKRAVGIECTNCGKYVLTNTPWICGVCGTRNLRADYFPFIGRCQNPKCGTEPKAYECHHCRKLIFFTPDRQKTGFARSASVPLETKPPPVKRDEHADALAAKKKAIERKALEVAEAKIDVELKGYRETLNPPKQRSVRERLRSKVGGKTELDDEVRRMKAEADEKFKDDPVEREKQHRLIEDEARDLLM